MPPLPPAVLVASRTRRSLISRRHLLELDCSPTAIERWLKSGTLERVLAGQYRVGGAARDLLQRLETAVHRCGAKARVDGAWACALHGLEGFDFTGSRQITIPRA